MLAREVAQLVHLRLDFLYLCLKDFDARLRRHARIVLIQGKARLGNAIGCPRDCRELLVQRGFTPIELGLKIGGLVRIPGGIVEPGRIDRKRGFGRRGRRLDRGFRCFLADDRDCLLYTSPSPRDS